MRTLCKDERRASLLALFIFVLLNKKGEDIPATVSKWKRAFPSRIRTLSAWSRIVVKPRNVGVAGFLYKTANAQAKAVFLFFGPRRTAGPRSRAALKYPLPLVACVSSGLWQTEIIRERFAKTNDERHFLALFIFVLLNKKSEDIPATVSKWKRAFPSRI